MPLIARGMSFRLVDLLNRNYTSEIHLVAVDIRQKLIRKKIKTIGLR